MYFRAPIGGLKKNPYGINNIKEKEKDNGEVKLEDKKKEKKKKEKKKKPPTTKEIREHIDKMIEMHGKMVEQETPTLYPLLTEKKKRKRKDNSEKEMGVNGKRTINMAGLPIVYGNDTKGNKSKYMLAGQTGKTLR